MNIHVASGLFLPLEAVTQTFAVIGRKGAGKTYLATMIAEQMLDAGAQLVVLDPVGNWWGLRVGADGRSKGKEIFVLGGDHGDVPIVPESGPRLAKLIVEKNISAVLDISSFRLHERKRFCWEFAEELLHLKKRKRTAIHLMIEEAQLLIPERVSRDEARMVGAFEQIVRLGRNYGIGCTLVTQRPQSVNKNALNQIECLFVLQVTGPHERKALEGWVQEVGADRSLIGELPGLACGEGYVWSPAWLRIYKKVRFRTKQTFDASATPEVGRAAKAASLSAVDVEKLRTDLLDLIEKAKSEDPKELRRRITVLEGELKKAKGSASTIDPEEIIKIRHAGAEAMMKVFLSNVRIAERQISQVLASITSGIVHAAIDISGNASKYAGNPKARNPPEKPGASTARTDSPIAFTIKELAPAGAESHDVGGGLRRMLIALAQRNGLSSRQLGVRAGLSSYSGTFGTYLGRARANGWITGDRSRLEITQKGRLALGSYSLLPEGRELLAYWVSELGNSGAARMLTVLAERYPKAITAEELGEEAGLSSGSGTFGTYLGKLRTLELVNGPRSCLRASEDLFEN
jgi:hypothetical protein